MGETIKTTIFFILVALLLTGVVIIFSGSISSPYTPIQTGVYKYVDSKFGHWFGKKMEVVSVNEEEGTIDCVFTSINSNSETEQYETQLKRWSIGPLFKNKGLYKDDDSRIYMNLGKYNINITDIKNQFSGSYDSLEELDMKDINEFLDIEDNKETEKSFISTTVFFDRRIDDSLLLCFYNVGVKEVTNNQYTPILIKTDTELNLSSGEEISVSGEFGGYKYLQGFEYLPIFNITEIKKVN